MSATMKNATHFNVNGPYGRIFQLQDVQGNSKKWVDAINRLRKNEYDL
jgi:hypothetical protein